MIQIPFKSKLVKDIKKNIPKNECKWIAKSLQWEIKSNNRNKKALRKMGLNIPINKKKEHKPIVIPSLRKPMYPFQNVGVGFFEKRKGKALLGDVMGLGKTVQAIGYLELHPELRPAIVVCPASVKLGWRQEILEWTYTKATNIHVLKGRKAFAVGSNKDIFIINYDILGNVNENTSWINHLMKLKPKVLILDECHFIKNTSTIRFKTIDEIHKKIPHILALSGTPIDNRPIDIFPVLKLIDPIQWKSKWEFGQKYCNLKRGRWGWDFTGIGDLKALHKKLTNFKTGIMLRRTKEEVLPDLPLKTRSLIPLEIDNRKEYEEAKQNIVKWIVKNKSKLTKAKMKRVIKAKALVQIGILMRLALKGKMNAIIQWIEDFLNTGEKLVLFGIHIEGLDILEKHFKNKCVRLKGGSPIEIRAKAVKQFQEDDRVLLFISGIKTAGTGLNGLQYNCSASCFTELEHNPSRHDQAEDRVLRIGQKCHVTAYYLIAIDTIDINILELQNRKRDANKQALEGKTIDDSNMIENLLTSIEKGN